MKYLTRIRVQLLAGIVAIVGGSLLWVRNSHVPVWALATTWPHDRYITGYVTKALAYWGRGLVILGIVLALSGIIRFFRQPMKMKQWGDWLLRNLIPVLIGAGGVVVAVGVFLWRSSKPYKYTEVGIGLGLIALGSISVATGMLLLTKKKP